MLCTVLTEPGDVVIVEEPTYFLAFQMFRDHGLEIRGVPIDARRPRRRAPWPRPSRRSATRASESRSPTPSRRSRTRPASRCRRNAASQLVGCSRSRRRADRRRRGVPPVALRARADAAADVGVSSTMGRSCRSARSPRSSLPGMRLGWIHGSIAAPRRAGGLGADPQRGRSQPGHVEPGDGDDADGLASRSTSSGCEPRSPGVRRRWSPRFAQHMPDWVQYDVPPAGTSCGCACRPAPMARRCAALAKQHGVDVRHGAQFSPTGALGNHLRLSYAFYDDADIAEGVARLGDALRSA